MKKTKIMLVVIALFAADFVFANEMEWVDMSGGKTGLKTVLVQPDNSKVVYIGLKGGIFKTENSGQTWRPVFSIRGQNNYVNILMFDPVSKSNLFAATGSGLYFSDNQGRSWKRIFKGRNYLENECAAIAVLPGRIYLGTNGGLFVSSDRGRSWRKETGEAGNSRIFNISCDFKEPGRIYVVSAKGVFKAGVNGQLWEKIFVAGAAKTDSSSQAEERNEESEEKANTQLRCLSIDPGNTNHIYLATSAGIYMSQDKGVSWQSISSYGLLNRDVKFLLISKNGSFYAVTKSGIFEYYDRRWHELSTRLVSSEIRSLDLDNQGNLYAACDNGLFKSSLRDFSGHTQRNITAEYCKNEPGVSNVQKAAIKYAEVEPEKIIRWRKQAARKAFLPKLSAGINRNTADLWHWESGSSTKAGDDDLVKGRDAIGWDVTLSWDLGEIIWNDAQTSIDVRSRLLVELRDDILDEVTKLYFERLRVKAELDNLSIEDRKKRFEKELRLEELAASLDALTGGYFSEKTGSELF